MQRQSVDARNVHLYTHIFKDGFHKRDGDFGLLDKVILGILNFEACMLLFRRVGILQATIP